MTRSNPRSSATLTANSPDDPPHDSIGFALHFGGARWREHHNCPAGGRPAAARAAIHMGKRSLCIVTKCSSGPSTSRAAWLTANNVASGTMARAAARSSHADDAPPRTIALRLIFQTDNASQPSAARNVRYRCHVGRIGAWAGPFKFINHGFAALQAIAHKKIEIMLRWHSRAIRRRIRNSHIQPCAGYPR